MTINFPWGSLRDGLLAGDGGLLAGLQAAMLPGARLEVLERLGPAELLDLPLRERVREQLAQAGFHPRKMHLLDAAALRALPSTWAKRLAFSHRPEAIYLES